MKGKKIMGNAGKATLPNGEKLSDKIQKNKVNQGVNNPKKGSSNAANSSDSNKGATSTSGSSKTNQKTDNKKQQESKGKTSTGLPDVQGMGAEAAREALKKAAGAVPYTKWIPKGIRDKIIDKFMDSDTGQAMVEKSFKNVKQKIILLIVGVVAALLMGLLMIAAIATLIMSPIAWLEDVFNAVGDVALSFGNFVLGNGWCSDEEECAKDSQNYYYNRLTTRADEYKKQCNIELNQELITATIFYDRMITKEPASKDENNNIEPTDQFNSESDDINMDTYYTYRQADADEIDKLVTVYRNRSFAASCPVNVLGNLRDIINDISALLEGKFTPDQIDNLLTTMLHDKTGVPTIAELVDTFGEVIDGERNLWEELLNLVEGSLSCFELAWDNIKSIVGQGADECSFDRDYYKNYLINYYIDSHYSYLTGNDYNMTKEEIADEILLLGDALVANSQLTVIEDTDGLFTMLPSNLNLRVTSKPANCRCHPTKRIYQSHKGVDIGGAPYGTEILALDDGVVESTTIRTKLSCGSSIIKLKHTTDAGEVYYTRYVHLNRASNVLLSNLKPGTNVTKGQVIGYVGGTPTEDSCSTGPHLHFEIHNSENKVINPVVALNNHANGIDILANQELVETCSVNGGKC